MTIRFDPYYNHSPIPEHDAPLPIPDRAGVHPARTVNFECNVLNRVS